MSDNQLMSYDNSYNVWWLIMSSDNCQSWHMRRKCVTNVMQYDVVPRLRSSRRNPTYLGGVGVLGHDALPQQQSQVSIEQLMQLLYLPLPWSDRWTCYMCIIWLFQPHEEQNECCLGDLKPWLGTWLQCYVVALHVILLVLNVNSNANVNSKRKTYVSALLPAPLRPMDETQ